VGARPQFIKAAPVSATLRQSFTEILVHTGQHYDHGMSAVFFQELGIPEPEYNLGIGSGSHGQQTGQMLAAIEAVLLKEKPDWMLVYGDTNSTLAGALAAAKLHIPIAHVEAGLRSYNRTMPEEINRVLTDHCSNLLFCPTQTAVDNLVSEGIHQGVHQVGDVMVDALYYFLPKAEQSPILSQHSLTPGNYVLATIHRASNTDTVEALAQVLDCLAQSAWPVVWPIHPRTAAALNRFALTHPPNVRLIPPVGYLEMLALEKQARFILTDSGGVQKEAYIFAVPCITLREDTEWVETVAQGWNTLTGADAAKVREALARPRPDTTPPPVFGDGAAAAKIAHYLQS
jgi:UDP-N-acetylglucosamine 2-epimerase